jgi:hypothetical protein
MATSSPPNKGATKLIFLDIPAGVAIEETIELTKPCYDFLALLSQMTGSTCKLIKRLDCGYEVKESGLNLSDGCWWYRIVKIGTTNEGLPQHTKGDWYRLATLFAYDQMREKVLAAGLSLEEGWVEIQHVSALSCDFKIFTTSLTLYNSGPSEEARRSDSYQGS